MPCRNRTATSGPATAIEVLTCSLPFPGAPITALRLTASPFEQLLVHVLGAFVIEQLEVLLEAAIEDQAQFPRSREHLGIVDRRLVTDVGGVRRREAFHDLERVAVKVSCRVEPGLVAQTHRVD